MKHIQKLVLSGLLLTYPGAVLGIDLSTCSSGMGLGYGMQVYCGDVEALSGTTVYQGGGNYAFDTSSGTIETAVYKGGCLTDDILSGTGLKLSSEICPDENKPYIDLNSSNCACVECLIDAHCAQRTDGKTSCNTTNKVCQQSGCTSNEDCEAGYFCAFQNAPSCSDKGSGTCKVISDISEPVSGFIYSLVGMTWWSAQNWCYAQGMIPATRDLLGCSGETYRCDSDIVSAFTTGWSSSQGVWVDDYGDSCKGYYMRLSLGYMYNGTRSVGWAGALCYKP